MKGLLELLGIGQRELIAIVGAGGKSTLLAGLGRELASVGASVVVTTTTKMGADQVTAPSIFASDPRTIVDAIEPGVPLFAGASLSDDKVTGLTADVVAKVFSSDRVDAVVVEADGARSRLIKAPAPHEPVVPSTATTVVVVASLAAAGRRIDEVAHRPQLVAGILGRPITHVLTAHDMETVLTHEHGGMYGIPPGATVVIALVAPTQRHVENAEELCASLAGHTRVDRAVIVPW